MGVYVELVLLGSQRKWASSIALPWSLSSILLPSLSTRAFILWLFPYGFFAILATSHESFEPCSSKTSCQQSLFLFLTILLILPFSFFHCSHFLLLAVLLVGPIPPLLLLQTDCNCALSSLSHHRFDLSHSLTSLLNDFVRLRSFS